MGDVARAFHSASSNSGQGGGLLYTTEMEAGSSNEKQYPPNKEISCVACSTNSGAVYTRFGNKWCRTGSKKLYDGFVASSHYNHNGGGADYLCMHPKPQYPKGATTQNNNGNLLYGVEYENQGSGTGNKNHNKDAACVVCQTTFQTVYTQWGRRTCSNGHKLAYSGVVMSTHYSQRGRAGTICVDDARMFHAGNHNGNHNGGLLYATEMEAGSSNEKQYPPNREVSCAVCMA